MSLRAACLHLLILAAACRMACAQPEDTNLVYAAGHLDLRSFIIIQKDWKILQVNPGEPGPARVVLMSRENLVRDTLGDMRLSYVLPVADNKLILGTMDVNLYIYEFRKDSLLKLKEIGFCHPTGMMGIAVFHDRIVSVNGLAKPPYVAVTAADTSRSGCLDIIRGRVLIHGLMRYKLSDKLVYSLPYTLGLTTEEVAVFLRDAQELLLLKRNNHYERVVLPYHRQHVWHYFHDWQAGKHYFVRATKSSGLELYELYGEKAIYIQPIKTFPTQIINGHLIYCEGSFRTNCDFYSKKISYRPVGQDVPLKVLRETLRQE